MKQYIPFIIPLDLPTQDVNGREFLLSQTWFRNHGFKKILLPAPSVSLKMRTTLGLNSAFLSTGSKVLPQTSSDAYTHAHAETDSMLTFLDQAQTATMYSHLDGLPRKGGKYYCTDCQWFKAPMWVSEWRAGLWWQQGFLAVWLPMTAKVLYKHQADHHFPSSVTLSALLPQRILSPKTKT